ncbi:flagellar hook-length control protein FliK [Marmoricola sp. OAE513]|uniref:flagellar hook-length control protein FliK n=1 Tax=Marmoricola sp. OAE513 TaxID=2817894 RepID=UPI001AEAE1CF
MSITPLATAVPAVAPAAGAGDTAALPGDFLAVIQAAMSQAAPVVEQPPVVELAETSAPDLPTRPHPTQNSVDGPTPPDGNSVDGPTPTDGTPPLVEEAGLQLPQPTGDLPIDPALAAVIAQVPFVVSVAVPVAHRVSTSSTTGDGSTTGEGSTTGAGSTNARSTTAASSATEHVSAGSTPELPQAAHSAADRPIAAPHAPARGAAHDSAVAGTTPPTTEPASVPADAGTPTAPVPATALQTAAPSAAQHHSALQATPAIASPAPVAAAATPAPVAGTTQLDQVAAQVFPEVTQLVSRGNGTHRIALTLNPEQLGEVRVIMTMRDGNVHVRLAAGHEAKASLLDGSPELARLLEHAGASEARVVVHDLPAGLANSTSTTSTPTSTLNAGDPALGGDRSPDQHAGTRADQHTAKDGSDQTSRSTRTSGTTATGITPRSIEPVIGTRVAGVDLTM